jgi:hypothetical protein
MKTIPTFTQFRNTAESIQDISQHADYGHYDKSQGLLYCDGKFYIESTCHNVYTVELFGYVFQGSLIDCEAEIWSAAIAEDAIDASTF